MGFKRVWDSSCPHIWDSWEVDGIKSVIRDIPPEDDEEALNVLMEHMCCDETMFTITDIVNDPVSMKSLRDYWRQYLTKRMSLGCYEEKDGRSKLVAINVCGVSCKGEEANDKIEGKAWQTVFAAMNYCFDRANAFEILGLDKVLTACGLVVHREYRGARLASKVLAAREPLALHYGILGTSTVFSSPAAHKSAERAGFFTALTATVREMSDAGLDLPKDDRCLKLMMRKYVE